MSSSPSTNSSDRSHRSWNRGSRVVSEMNSRPWTAKVAATASAVPGQPGGGGRRGGGIPPSPLWQTAGRAVGAAEARRRYAVQPAHG